MWLPNVRAIFSNPLERMRQAHHHLNNALFVHRAAINQAKRAIEGEDRARTNLRDVMKVVVHRLEEEEQ
jgi:hypothetical protein